MNTILLQSCVATHLTRIHVSSHPIKNPSPHKTPPSRRPSTSLLRAGGARGFGGPEDRSTDDDKTDRRRNADEEDDEIPKVVFDRMLRRILVFVGSPVGAGIGLLYVMSALKEQNVWDVPPWVPFVTALLSFGTSALGIAYGTLSSSWDAEREGSLLGWEEAQRNWPELWKDEEEEKKKNKKKA